jgi:hypothetical protein
MFVYSDYPSLPLPSLFSFFRVGWMRPPADGRPWQEAEAQGRRGELGHFQMVLCDMYYIHACETEMTHCMLVVWGRATMKAKSLQRVLDEAGLGEDYQYHLLMQPQVNHQHQHRQAQGGEPSSGSSGPSPPANYVTVCAAPSALPKRLVHLVLSPHAYVNFNRSPLSYPLACVCVPPQEVLLCVRLLRALRLRPLRLAALQRPLLPQPRRDPLPEILPVNTDHWLCM